MLEKLNPNRLNFVLPIGRRFYTAVMMVFKFFNNLNITSGSSSLNGIRDESATNIDYKYDIRFTFSDANGTFHPLAIYSTDNEEEETALYQLFSFFDSEMYLNIYKYINRHQFMKHYCRKYSQEVSSIYYAVSQCIVPMELNIGRFKIKCSYGTKTLYDSRYPLIDALYRSDEVVDFINHLTVGMMFSTHLYYEFYENMILCREDYSRERYFNEEFERFNKTWTHEFLNLRKHFSLMR